MFFRSPQPSRSWITAAGAVLDGAALRASTMDGPRDPEADLCIRAGYVALRRRADFFQIPYDPDPGDPISISRKEYDAALLGLAALTMAPEAPWSSDRGVTFKRPPLLHWRNPGSFRRGRAGNVAS